jgi:exoribonuclease R
VPCVLLFQGGMRCVVNTKKETKRNQWAKIRISEAGDAANQSAEMKTGEIMEILGPVGDFDTELKAYQLHFNILPCRYPTIDLWGLLPAIDVDSLEPGRQDCTHLRVISIDNASTRDIDDALSFEFEGAGDMATCRIGIHVADVAARVPTNSPLFEWARVRASSAYHHGPSDDGMGGGSVPMLPPQLAHGSLSLNEGQMRPAVTLWLYVEMGCIVKREHARTLIVNSCATTYALFGEDEEPDFVRSRGLLEMLSGASLPEDLVAWTMVEYNGYFGTLLAQRAAAAATSQGQGLLRVQATPDEAALYALASPAAASGAQRHAKLGLDTYAHMSSPIRRFSDLFNQHILFSSLHSASLVHPGISSSLSSRS